MFGRRNHQDDALRCSFCRKSQDVVGKLISSPSDYPRAYICDECIAVCNSILEDDTIIPQEGDSMPRPGIRRISHPSASHPLSHPFASQFFDYVEQWVTLEKTCGDSSQALAEMRRIAAIMIAAKAQHPGSC